MTRRAWLAGSVGLLIERPWNRPVPLGKSGLQVTPLGFGCDEGTDARLIRRAAELGLNYFQMCDSRGSQIDFAALAAGLKPVRKQLVLSTGSSGGRTGKEILGDIEQQLTGLHIGWTDLFYLWAGKPDHLGENQLEALAAAKKAGKIRA